MATLNGQIFGDMSGKLGGMVFSRTNAGKVVRAHVVGTDAKSAAQVSVRSKFSTVVSMWQTLTDTQRAAWNTFATTLYRAKKAGSTVAYSGYQAFLAMNMSLQNMASHFWGFDITAPPIVGTYGTFPTTILVAPTVGFSSQIQTSAAAALSLSLNSAGFVASTGALTFDINMNPAPVATSPLYENPTSNKPVGFSLYFSKVISPGRSTVSNFEAYCMCSVGAPTVTSGWVSCSKFTVSGIVPSSYLSSLKAGFSAGNKVFATLYANGLDGQSAKIGVVQLTIS